LTSDARVWDLMSAGVIGVRTDADLATVAAVLVHRRVHAVFVLDGAGRPAGVLSDFDLLAGEWLGGEPDGLDAMRRVTAGELMSTPVQTIEADAPAALAAERMRELHLSRLLVTGPDGSAIGVVSVSDLVAPLGRPSGARGRVRDVMSHAIVTCSEDTTLHDAARALTERRSRSLVVVDAGGRAAGVITGNDLLGLYADREPTSTVAELMSTPITCDADLALPQAADLILRHEVHRLVVVDGMGAPVGVLSTTDIVAEMAVAGSVWQGSA
jgi:CBS domain-containing protein